MPAAPASTSSDAPTVATAMRRRFKLLAVLVGVPALLIVVVVMVLPMVIDSDQYKGEVIALVKKHTGYDLHIDGRLRLHLVPNLRLTVTDLRLANAPGFESADLARLPWLAVDLNLWALFGGRMEFDGIDARGLRVNLERDRSGRGNWQAAGVAVRDDRAPLAVMAAVAVRTVDIRDASLLWRDQSSDERVLVTAIQVQTGALNSTRAIDDIRLQATVMDSGLRVEARGDAVLNANADTLAIPALTATFANLSIAGMQAEGTVTAKLTAALADRRLALDALRVSARMAGGEDRLARVEITTALDLDLAEHRFTGTTIAVKVPAFAFPGVAGALTLTGLLSGDVAASRYTLKRLRAEGTLAGPALNDSGVAFALTGSLDADLEKQTLLAPRLEIAGSVDGNGLPFRCLAQVELSERARTLAATGMQLSIGDWQVDGDVTLHAATSPRGLRGVLDLRVRDQWLAGSFAATESTPGADGIDVRADLTAELDLEAGGYVLRGRNALALRTRLNPAGDAWRVSDLQLDARLADASLADGALSVALRADALIDSANAGVRSDNLQMRVGDSNIAGSVHVRGFDDPTVRIDLDVDAIDADRFLLPATGTRARAMPVGVSIDALRALDLAGEIRVRTLTLKGVHMHDVRLSAGPGASGG